MHEWSHIPLRRREFLDICSLLYERFGIHYDTPKQSLICDRLQKVLRRHGMASFADYVEYLRRDASGRALLELADVMSTNYTYFFREEDHFEFLQKKSCRLCKPVETVSCAFGRLVVPPAKKYIP
ncbi:hypothetical protein [Anaeromusa acidaminophila]|uniref:hypothetical protein n=1 Tax=Anaeromusa acidaminophila TaxID=81464 RepID=UPI0003A1BBBE|nr:hypothetical protein [Anaeromusa acidaminophila]